VAAIMLVSFGITFFGVHERRDQRTESEHLPFRRYVASLFGNRQALIYLCCLFAFNFGVNAVQPYLTLFAEHVIGTSEQMALVIAAVFLATALLAAFPIGYLADRFGTRKLLAISFGLLTVAGGLGLVIQDVPQTLGALVVAGVGTAGVAVTNYPLLVRLIPATQVGVYTGIKTTFESIAIPASVFVTGSLINAFGYRSIFFVLVAAILAALAILATVRVPTTQPEEGDLAPLPAGA